MAPVKQHVHLFALSALALISGFLLYRNYRKLMYRLNVMEQRQQQLQQQVSTLQVKSSSLEESPQTQLPPMPVVTSVGLPAMCEVPKEKEEEVVEKIPLNGQLSHLQSQYQQFENVLESDSEESDESESESESEDENEDDDEENLSEEVKEVKEVVKSEENEDGEISLSAADIQEIEGLNSFDPSEMTVVELRENISQLGGQWKGRMKKSELITLYSSLSA